MTKRKNIAQKGPAGNTPSTPCDKGLIRLDAELGIVALDEHSGRLIGLPPESLLGRKLDEVFDLENLRNATGTPPREA